jgi:toxin ParE1/3/4
MRVEFHPRAEEEFVEEAAYYEERVAGLGDSFISELEVATTLLEDHPGIGAELESPFRYLPIRRFPHSLIYIIETSRIWVLAVAHQSRRPGYWRERSDR